MQARRTNMLVQSEHTAHEPLAGVTVTPAPAAARRLAAALDRVLDEGITDFAIRTRGDRRRVAALQSGFEAAESLLLRLESRGRRASPGTSERTRALLRVSRHLLFWAAATGREDRSGATRMAFEALRVAVRGAAGGLLSPTSDSTLMTCERCGARGAELDERSEAPARTRALCVACAVHARRLGRSAGRVD